MNKEHSAAQEALAGPDPEADGLALARSVLDTMRFWDASDRNYEVEFVIVKRSSWSQITDLARAYRIAHDVAGSKAPDATTPNA